MKEVGEYMQNSGKSIEKKFLPIINDFLAELERLLKEYGEDGLADMVDDEKYRFNFTNTELTPMTLCVLLKKLGYKEVNRGDNGWQLDYWIDFENPDAYIKELQVNGTGMEFTLHLDYLFY